MNDKDFAELNAGIATIVPADGLARKIAQAEKENRPLKVKLGFDPTAPDLHLGHAVVLRKLRQFQDAGHEINIIIGDFTARIGDPTGRNTARPPLTPEQVKINAETYVNQLAKVMDVSKVKLHFNSSWLEKMNFMDVIKLLAKATLAQMLQRNDFRERYEKSVPVALHELVYPIMQGYDSVVLDSDIELGGTDQLFNCMVGKDMQASYGSDTSQIVVSMPLLRGTDGVEKMSKSKGNYVALTDLPNDMYGKTMSIPDELLTEWIELTTDFSLAEKKEMIASIGSVNPMEIKKKVAANIVKIYHGEEAAKAAEEFFYNQVQAKDMEAKEYKPVALSENGITAESNILALLQILQPEQSKSALRRLAEGGGVSLDGEKITDVERKINDLPESFKLKVGKRGYFAITK
ncbi:MAG: tyrosine--tRNA ligase [Alphaproteobacteria bacterium]|nr:tyrosine--tRNA ligase [Alphaproteobacteria bacterium]